MLTEHHEALPRERETLVASPAGRVRVVQIPSGPGACSGKSHAPMVGSSQDWLVSQRTPASQHQTLLFWNFPSIFEDSRVIFLQAALFLCPHFGLVNPEPARHLCFPHTNMELSYFRNTGPGRGNLGAVSQELQCSRSLRGP